MHLAALTYEYKIPQKKFTSLSYTLSLPFPKGEEKEKLIASIKGEFATLDALVAARCGGEVQKREDGKITNREINFGYLYKDDAWVSKLYLTLSWAVQFKTAESSLQLYHIDNNAERLLGVYDDVRSLPHLIVSDDAQKVMKEIEMLRSSSENGESLSLQCLSLKVA